MSPVMRQHHVAGDMVFVDYSGKKIAVVDPVSSRFLAGERRMAGRGIHPARQPDRCPAS